MPFKGDEKFSPLNVRTSVHTQGRERRGSRGEGAPPFSHKACVHPINSPHFNDTGSVLVYNKYVFMSEKPSIPSDNPLGIKY